jgi:para-nitrobenzyl esterase
MKTVLFALFLGFLPRAMIAGETDSSELIGTSWKLVKIAYDDDTIYRPDDPTKYTLTFQDETQVATRIDCNRGYGTWKSSAPGQLEFGPMTTTQTMCPPGSLYGLVIHDLPNFRSYVLKDGKLFLFMMADGGIYEFEPLTK